MILVLILNVSQKNADLKDIACLKLLTERRALTEFRIELFRTASLFIYISPCIVEDRLLLYFIAVHIFQMFNIPIVCIAQTNNLISVNILYFLVL